MTDEVIELGSSVQEKALDAFYSDNYFEAVQLMQLHLESSVRTLLFSRGPKRAGSDFFHASDVLQEISLVQGIKSLYVFGVISQKQYTEAAKFNRIRNKMVHQLNAAKLGEKSKSIQKSEFENTFIRANDLSNEFIMQSIG